MVSRSHEGYKVEGDLLIDAIVSDAHITNKYSIQVFIPIDYPKVMPWVKEAGDKIQNYSHKYTDDTLCLATETDIRVNLSPAFKLKDWMWNYVIPYFITHSYFQRFGVYPYGDRSHGTIGIIEYYKDIFDTDDLLKIYSLLDFACGDKFYRGHLKCPCGSGVRIRKCHGKILRKLREPEVLESLKNDKFHIDKAIEMSKQKRRR